MKVIFVKVYLEDLNRQPERERYMKVYEEFRERLRNKRKETNEISIIQIRVF